MRGMTSMVKHMIGPIGETIVQVSSSTQGLTRTTKTFTIMKIDKTLSQTITGIHDLIKIFILIKGKTSTRISITIISKFILSKSKW